jgi:hypothetical protein
MDHRLRVVNLSDDEIEEYDLPPVKMCEECGRFPCQHWFARLRENTPDLMRHRLTMRRTLWSRWPRVKQPRRGRGPVAATAFAVGVLIAGVGINACVSGSDPVQPTARAPYIATGPGSTAVPLTAGPSTAGQPLATGHPSAGGGTAPAHAGSRPIAAATFWSRR